MSAHHTAVVKVVVKGRIHGQETNNVWHFGATGLEPNYAQLLLDIIECIFTTLYPAVSEDWLLESCTAQEVWPVKRDPIETVPVQPNNPQRSLPAQASFVAYLIKIRTGLGGRTNRGRMYLAGAVENDVNASRLTDGGLAKLAAFAACMVGKFIKREGYNPTFEIGVLSRKEAAVALATPQTAFTEATQLIPVREVKSMNSRKIGHGN